MPRFFFLFIICIAGVSLAYVFGNNKFAEKFENQVLETSSGVIESGKNLITRILKTPEPIKKEPAKIFEYTGSQSGVNQTTQVEKKEEYTPLPAEVNLDVPFTSQAPYKNWHHPYQDFCEEASALMAVRYVKGEKGHSIQEIDKELYDIKAFEEERFGYYKDTTIKETATILTDHFKFKHIEIKENPTLEDMKRALAKGQAIIVSAAGKDLKNPHFVAPGPLYHMIIVKGYTADGNFIANDPGTRAGADYLYDQQLLMDAMTDRGGQALNREKRVIFVGKD